MTTQVNFNGKTKWILWLSGVLFTIFITAITALGNNVIMNDKASRLRDSVLREKLATLSECMYTQNTEILQRLTRIETKLNK